MNPLSVLLVDNSASFLDLLEHYFANSSHVRIVGRAQGGAEAISALSQVRAEVVLMDMTMPGLDGLETARRMRRLPQPPRIVLMTGNDGTAYAEAAQRAGAEACLCKSDFFAQVPGIIDQLRRSGPAKSETLADPGADIHTSPAPQLSDNLVHDLNNLLTKIAGYAELTLRSLPANHASQAWLHEVQEAAQAAASLLSRGEPLRTFASAPESPVRKDESKQCGGETILVVEDDQGLLGFASRVLKANGYVVLEARQGCDATRICAEHAGPIHLAITDQNLTNIKGSELAGLLRSARPDLRILFMSGGGKASVPLSLNGEAPDFLAKPFTPAALVRTVREMLDRVMEATS